MLFLPPRIKVSLTHPPLLSLSLWKKFMFLTYTGGNYIYTSIYARLSFLEDGYTRCDVTESVQNVDCTPSHGKGRDREYSENKMPEIACPSMFAQEVKEENGEGGRKSSR
jgi:hypothetical protein